MERLWRHQFRRTSLLLAFLLSMGFCALWRRFPAGPGTNSFRLGAAVCAASAGMFTAPFAGWIAWPATVVLNYMLDLAHILSHVHHVFLQNLQLSLARMLALKAVITGFSLLLRRKQSRRFMIQ